MLRSEFDYPDNLLYFNAAHQVFAPTSVLAAVVRELRDYEINPSVAFQTTPPRLRALEAKLAKFFYASVQDVFLRPNITSVLNTFIQGFPLGQKSEVLVSDFEYLSIQNAVRVRSQNGAVRMRRIALPSTPTALNALSEDALLEKLVSQLSPETGMVVISHITGGVGLKVPVGRLAKETRARGILLIVDGAHASGTEPIHFGELADVDAYAVSLQKAMFGPKGTALGWVAPHAQDKLRPTEGALGTFEKGGFAEAFRLAGSFDYSPFLALEATLALWERYGTSVILNETRRLRNQLAEQLSDVKGLQPCFSPDEKLQSSILTYRLNEEWKDQVETLAPQLLKDNNLQISAFRIQQAPHLQLSALAYNTDLEIQKTKKVLASLLSKASPGPL